MLGHLGHTLPQTPGQRKRQQIAQAKARQEARQRSAARATEKEADEAEAESPKVVKPRAAPKVPEGGVEPDRRWDHSGTCVR